MAANGRGGGQNHSYGINAANNKQAQLANAYQELGKELGSEKLKIVGGYTIGRVIGEGTYGSVHLATHRLTGTRCAIKKIPKSATAHLTREIHHHRSLHHPSIVHLHEIIATESHIWLVTELCSGGELFDYLVERGRMLEGEARKLFGELAVAVGWMHRQGVVHRDLKLENVLLDGELRIKLGDLGFAREWQRGRLMETFCGTTGYASPEMLAGRRYLGEETDIWSLGIILYILLCGGLPFDDDDENVMKQLIAKGEYEEPEWLSDEATSLIRGMLQQEPTQRLSIEGILTHPWFKMTIVDKIRDVPGEKSAPTSPVAKSARTQDDYFSEPFNGTANAVAGPSRLLPPYVQAPSPLSSHVPTVPQAESEASETSEHVDSDHGKTSSGVTTPPTTTEGDDGDASPARTHSGEFSATEKALEMMHTNSSQSTIRRSGSDSPGAGPGPSSYKSRVAMRTTLEGQVVEEEPEDADAQGEGRDDISLHLPVAQHHRTPSRTKRRSVSSTLSLERRHSHHSMSGQWQTYLPDDYVAKLNEERPPPFSTPSEKHLLLLLNDLGFDIGQLRHSVESNACDSSAAVWWILRQKQFGRGETDDVITSRQASEARKRERAAAFAREERRKAREEGTSREQQVEPRSAGAGVAFIDEPTAIPVTPSFNVVDLGAPIPPTPGSSSNPAGIPLHAIPFASPPAIELKPPPSMLAPSQTTNISPQTPPRISTRDLATPDTSPATAADKERSKLRSPSMNMLQRATSVWAGGKRNEDKEKAGESPASYKEQKEEKRGPSPTKLHKAPPKTRRARSESDSGLIGVVGAKLPQQHQPQPAGGLSPIASGDSTPNFGSPQREKVPPRSRLPASTSAGSNIDVEGSPVGSVRSVTAETLAGMGPPQPKGPKKDSLWTSFRHLFNEERRRRKSKELSPATSTNGGGGGFKAVPAVVLARGPNARPSHSHSHTSRLSGTPGSRRTSIDNPTRPAMHSRRSSSVNSRRSSFNAPHPHSSTSAAGLTGPAGGEQDLVPGLNRRTSGKAPSHGSQTPTSDREFLERPSSSHSLQRGGSRSRRSSMSVRSPSLHSEASGRFKSGVGAPPSPLLNHRRRAAGGSDSTRVRHIRVIPESQILRSSSVASSIRSNASSRASSVERNRDRSSRGAGEGGESEYDSAAASGADDSRPSHRPRSRGNGMSEGHSNSRRLYSLAEQIHRTRSPLSANQQGLTPLHGASTHAHGLAKEREKEKEARKPLRDVFQSNKSKGMGDDDWISEDEEEEFAGGLGQGQSQGRVVNGLGIGGAAGTALGGGGTGAIWMNGTRAAAFPSAGAGGGTSGRMGGGGARRRERGRKGSKEGVGSEDDTSVFALGGGTAAAAAASAASAGAGSGGGAAGGGRQRRGVASGRTATVIEEEEEEEEDEE